MSSETVSPNTLLVPKFKVLNSNFLIEFYMRAEKLTFHPMPREK